jgi:hypothetical protein
MKNLFSFMLAVMIAGSSLVQAQNPQTSQGNIQPDFKASQAKLVAMTVGIASKVQQASLEGYLAILVDERSWTGALKDSDLGPFVKLSPAKTGRRAVLLMSPKADAVICVFYDEELPFGVAAAQSPKKGKKITDADAAASYKLVTPEMQTANEKSLGLTEGYVKTDEGISMTTYQITFNTTP